MEELLKNPELLSLKNSLAGIMLIMVLNILLVIAKAVWDFMKRKVDTSENTTKQNTDAIIALTASVQALQKEIAVIPKVQTDLKRSFLALKKLAGDNWPEIKKEFEDEHLF